MKALIISGGGSKGAFAGGVAEYLIKDQQNKYDIFGGSSVGSILISQLALGNINLIKDTFTTISNKDIFSVDPFKIKEKNGNYEISINHFNTLRVFLKGYSTFGESKRLRKLIEKIHPEEDFIKLKNSKQVFFTVSNLTQGKLEYINVNECNYTDYCDWMWASANYVPFMSLMTKNGNQYADGGFGNFVPILHAVNLGANEIDVIILDEENKQEITNPTLVNPFQSLMGVFMFMSNQIGLKDVVIGKLKGYKHQIDIKLWYPPNEITNNPLYFNPKLMTKWWEDGYNYAKTNQPICHYFK